MVADLHLHTHYSDGNWTPQGLIDHAVKLGFDCIAITDHDTVGALSEARSYAEGKIRLINGIEFNTIWQNPNGDAQDVHILGYFIDPEHAALHDAMQRQQKARNEHLTETINRLREQGHELDIEAVKASAGKGSIGRPHICAAMLKAGITNDIQQAYRMLMNRQSQTRVLRRSIHPADAIAAITASGGIPSLAHPGKDSFIPELVAELQSRGLKAIEAFHRGHSLSQVRKYQKMAKSHGLIITGGSDCHGPFENYPVSLGSVKIQPNVLRDMEDLLKNRSS
jgi:predicted metal-dependent phosphoesterase TrpH